MIVHVYTVTRNESTILPWFLRHYGHYGFAESIFVYDDHSDDGSKEIVFSKFGTLWMDLDFTGLDDAKIADLFSNAYKKHSRGIADWVICVDADEFIYHPDLVNKLRQLKVEGIQVVACDGYQMLSEELPKNGYQIYDTIREGIPDPRYSKAVVFSPEIDIRFAPGRHEFFLPQPCVVAKDTGIKLLHYRFLSEEYVRMKHAQNYSRLTDANKASGWGGHNAPTYSGEYDLAWYRRVLKEKKPCID